MISILLESIHLKFCMCSFLIIIIVVKKFAFNLMLIWSNDISRHWGGLKNKMKQKDFPSAISNCFETKTPNMSLCSFWKPILENIFNETNQTSHIYWLLFCFPKRKSTNFCTIDLALSQAFVVLQTWQDDNLGLHFVSLLFFGFLLNKWSKSSQL